MRELLLPLAVAVSVVCAATAQPLHGQPEFRDVAGDVGLEFHTSHGGSGRRLFIEVAPGGVAIFDYDDDGWPDVYLVNGAPTAGYTGEGPLRNALFRNRGDGTFEDVTSASGVGDEGYGNGVAIGDVDGDTRLDIFVANYGPDRLFRNNGDGTFTDTTATSGLGDSRWSTSAAFLDYDTDGDADLYVAHYVDYDASDPPPCLGPGGVEEYCNPGDFEGVRDSLYENVGEGRFEEVTLGAGIGESNGRGYGVTVADFDDDVDLDIYVANDQNRNNLFRNNGDGTFTDVGLFAGVGYGSMGLAEAGMGCDFGDFDGDLLLDLVVTNFSSESNSLYRNLGSELFIDQSFARGVGEATAHSLAFGGGFIDADLDGDLDLFFACGHVLDTIERHGQGQTFAQTDLLLENREGYFSDISNQAGPAFAERRVGRAAAFGDLDNDGDLDIVVTHFDDSIALYRNEQASDRAALLLDLRTKSGQPAIGARIVLVADGRKQLRHMRGAASFQAHHDLRVHFGLGASRQVERLEIRWPSGTTETLTGMDAGQILTIREGEGVVASHALSKE